MLYNIFDGSSISKMSNPKTKNSVIANKIVDNDHIKQYIDEAGKMCLISV